MVERLCREEDVVYMDLWDSFVGNEDMSGQQFLPRDCQGRSPVAWVK